jgi:hypothetical protein
MIYIGNWKHNVIIGGNAVVLKRKKPVPKNKPAIKGKMLRRFVHVYLQFI